MKNTYEAIKVDDLTCFISNKRPYLYSFIIFDMINYFKNFMNDRDNIYLTHFYDYFSFLLFNFFSI